MAHFEHLYIHVPFCARRCTYCDFSIAVRATVPVDSYLDALTAEWGTRHHDSSLRLKTLYFGGGTPSKLGPDGVQRAMDLVRTRASVLPDAEVTLEANPEDITPNSVRAWLAAGINRLSIGVQSFDDKVLAWMHRTHDAAAARRVVEIARDSGLENVSIDLIFAVPQSLARDWARDVATAVETQLPHISVYGLTVEDRTPLGKWVARRQATEAPEENFESEFLHAHQVLTAAGLEHYEVSNYGAPGKHSRHNWAYWRRVPYMALGPSAHEFGAGSRRWNTEAFAAWEAKALGKLDTTEGFEDLNPAAQLAEETYLGLRTETGIRLSAEIAKQVMPWTEAGWATIEDDVVRLTALGWLRLDSLAADLTARRSRY